MVEQTGSNKFILTRNNRWFLPLRIIFPTAFMQLTGRRDTKEERAFFNGQCGAMFQPLLMVPDPCVTPFLIFSRSSSSSAQASSIYKLQQDWDCTFDKHIYGNSRVVFFPCAIKQREEQFIDFTNWFLAFGIRFSSVIVILRRYHGLRMWHGPQLLSHLLSLRILQMAEHRTQHLLVLTPLTHVCAKKVRAWNHRESCGEKQNVSKENHYNELKEKSKPCSCKSSCKLESILGPSAKEASCDQSDISSRLQAFHVGFKTHLEIAWCTWLKTHNLPRFSTINDDHPCIASSFTSAWHLQNWPRLQVKPRQLHRGWRGSNSAATKHGMPPANPSNAGFHEEQKNRIKMSQDLVGIRMIHQGLKMEFLRFDSVWFCMF